MEEKEKTTVVSLSTIKGGVGKTHIAILLANCLAGAGKRVLVIDSDLNNSLSFHYLEKETMEKTRKLNLAAALGDESNDLRDFAVPTATPGSASSRRPPTSPICGPSAKNGSRGCCRPCTARTTS